ncbi:spore protease YyaC [Oceanobacillus sp. CAU 1775]
MNHNHTFQRELTEFRVPYQDKEAIEKLHTQIISWFPRLPREYIVACIGTDRSTGDSLGPLVGSMLKTKKLQHIKVYGSLHEPIHAVNLTDNIEMIANKHRKPFIIAIDACLGRNSSIGQLITGVGPIQPGAALKKDLPPIGDIHITGVVNMGGFMEHSILQNTRLSIVMDMAEMIATVIDSLDQQLSDAFIRTAIIKKSQPM